MHEQHDGSASLRETASKYAEIGWQVFPCHTVTDRGCSCGKADCDSIGKHPRTANGLKDASADPRQFDRWWPSGSSLAANIAVATGRTSHILVIDIDPRHGGDDTLAQLEAEFGALPRNCSVMTGGGGLHIYCRYPDGTTIRSRNGWRPGIDIKADGGYVIAPPSVHQSGNCYEWRLRCQQDPPPLLPRWLAALTQTEETPSSERSLRTDARSLLLQRAQQYTASVPAATEGGRNDSAFQLAGHVASFATDAGDRLGKSEVFDVVRSWNARCTPPLGDDELRTCVASALTNGKPRATKVVNIPADSNNKESERDPVPESGQKTQATTLVELAEGAELFHDLDGEAYARFPVGDEEVHWHVARVRTRPFKRWLAQRFYRTQGKVPAAQSQQDALGVIEAKAIFDGDKHAVDIRVAEHDGRIYYDLCNDRWQVVEINKNGWRILDDSPVMFRRSKAMLPLPTPRSDGNIDELRRFANVTDEDWPLVLAWLIATFRPTGPYPVLAVHGEHGSGKSGLCRRLRSLADPNTSPLRGDYREPRDLMICANSGWVVALDNLSRIPDWLSDCFCRLATGGGFSTRTLYENDEETIFDSTRPLILNCIDEVVTRSDLLDRCILVNLPRIEPDQRLSEKQLDREFEAARPLILGGLLSAVASALRREESVQLQSMPRMADFAIWATAAETGLGLRSGEFLAAYQANRDAGNDSAIEASPIGKALIDFVAEIGQWSGTSTQLLKELEERAGEKTIRLKSWPSTPRKLGSDVKRLAPNLRDAGIAIEFSRKGKQRTRLIVLSRPPERTEIPSSASSAPSAGHESSENTDFAADAKADTEFEADANVDQADARSIEPLSAESALIPEENGLADMADEADAGFPTHSLEPEWIEV